LAEYRDRLDDFEAAGYGLVAISADEPVRSEALREQLRLPFPILCDTRREVITSWGLLNRFEAGGVARPCLFVIDQRLRVLHRSGVGSWARVSAAALLDYLRSPSGPGRSGPRRRLLVPGPMELFRSVANTLRHGRRSPRIQRQLMDR